MYLFGHSFPNCATNLQKLPESRKFFATFFAASHLITPWKGEFRSAAEARRYGKADSAPPPSSGEKYGGAVFAPPPSRGRKYREADSDPPPSRGGKYGKADSDPPPSLSFEYLWFVFRVDLALAADRNPPFHMLRAREMAVRTTEPVIYPVHVFITMSSFYLPSRQRNLWRGGFRSAALALHSGIYDLCLGRVDYGGGSESAFPYASRPRDGCPRHGARSFILFMCLQQCHHSFCPHGRESYGEADSDPPHSHCIEYLRVLLWVDPPSTGYVL